MVRSCGHRPWTPSLPGRITERAVARFRGCPREGVPVFGCFDMFGIASSPLRFACAAAACAWAICAGVLGAEQAQVRKAGRWKTVPVQTLADLRGFRPQPVRLDQYGGLASGPRLRATGFFRTERVRGRWWLVDPEGRLFLSVGLCSVNLSMFDKGDAEKAFGDRDAWAARTAAMLREQGFNTLGRWSDAERFRGLGQPMPYTTSLSIMSAYAKQRDPKNGERGFPRECQPVFDPEFEAFCDRYAQRLAERKDDPWLLGHFTDNEIPFRPDSLRRYLDLPKTDPGYRAAEGFLKSRGRRPDEVTQADEADFLTLVAKRYYGTVAKAIRRHDPNHLVLGSRLNGRNINEAVFRGCGALDVISLNYYHRWSADKGELDRAAALSGRPVLNSEWYANVGQANAGYLVRTQRDRGLFYTHHVLSLLKNPNCVGWHWFKYGTHVDRQFRPHTDMTDLMRQVNRHVYTLAAYFVP